MVAEKRVEAHGPLSFSLVIKGQAPKHFTLQNTSSRVTIGRRLSSDFVLTCREVSFDHAVLHLGNKNRDTTLCIKDVSKNLTAFRHFKGANSSWCELRRDEFEVLHHRSQIRVPARLKRPDAGSVEQGDRRCEITVLLALPDAYCEWQRTGRWLYGEKLGEGGLAVVYCAKDMARGLGAVAIKVSKFSNLPLASQQNRHIYAMHREAQWSLQRLHNSEDSRYQEEPAALFVRYLEDHTGFLAHGPEHFDERRAHFEDPAFGWDKHKFDPALAGQPYLVMELVNGRLLQAVIEGTPPLVPDEKRTVIKHCTEALVYLQRFSAMHRDFRGCNLFLVDRGEECRVKVIDLGFMIADAPGQSTNPNPAVRCAWQGDPSKKVRFDWAPPEVRKNGSPNFASPASSFDVYSLGVLVLKMLRGRAWTQDVMQRQKHWLIKAMDRDFEEISLTADLVLQMLSADAPGSRPLPSHILKTFLAGNHPTPVPKEPAVVIEAATDVEKTEVRTSAPPEKKVEAISVDGRSPTQSPKKSPVVVAAEENSPDAELCAFENTPHMGSPDHETHGAPAVSQVAPPVIPVLPAVPVRPPLPARGTRQPFDFSCVNASRSKAMTRREEDGREVHDWKPVPLPPPMRDVRELPPPPPRRHDSPEDARWDDGFQACRTVYPAARAKSRSIPLSLPPAASPEPAPRSPVMEQQEVQDIPLPSLAPEEESPPHPTTPIFTSPRSSAEASPVKAVEDVPAVPVPERPAPVTQPPAPPAPEKVASPLKDPLGLLAGRSRRATPSVSGSPSRSPGVKRSAPRSDRSPVAKRSKSRDGLQRPVIVTPHAKHSRSRSPLRGSEPQCNDVKSRSRRRWSSGRRRHHFSRHERPERRHGRDERREDKRDEQPQQQRREPRPRQPQRPRQDRSRSPLHRESRRDTSRGESRGDRKRIESRCDSMRDKRERGDHSRPRHSGQAEKSNGRAPTHWSRQGSRERSTDGWRPGVAEAREWSADWRPGASGHGRWRSRSRSRRRRSRDSQDRDRESRGRDRWEKGRW
uniref:Protein kinase domain-containing protein n=1 Tax=Noctiluca scintillans TaxID=2966 RepID=A0A7S1F426_NOCSC|mmetsp:Transcript_30965/g.82242  ORF Transcript_30965/g.82242 Transcript_30965/m.82242 type:complete len:1032 (+) Transcript_30965:155-3250(+)